MEQTHATPLAASHLRAGAIYAGQTFSQAELDFAEQVLRQPAFQRLGLSQVQLAASFKLKGEPKQVLLHAILSGFTGEPLVRLIHEFASEGTES